MIVTEEIMMFRGSYDNVFAFNDLEHVLQSHESGEQTSIWQMIFRHLDAILYYYVGERVVNN
jgi:hypothetical protein